MLQQQQSCENEHTAEHTNRQLPNKRYACEDLILCHVFYAPPLIGGGIKRCFFLTSVCLSVVYIGPKSMTEGPRKTKIGTEVAHVTHDSDTTFKVKSHRGGGILWRPPAQLVYFHLERDELQ